MASKFIALAEEAVASYRTPGTDWMYFKLLNESLNTTREDFYPETTQYWTPGHRAEGFFRTAGDFATLVDPVMWPKLMVLLIGDGASTGPVDSGYTHVWKFGANEVVGTTAIKAFTSKVGVGIEKDRQLEGCFMNGITLEAEARDVVRSTVSVTGSGDESLQTAASPVYTAYTQPYLTFTSASVMTVGATDRLALDPMIQAFRLNLTRGWDTDHYVLGNRFIAAPVLSGMAAVSGSMDFSFTSEDEHERFLTAVGGAASGNQASFATVLTLEGALLGVSTKYTVSITIPDTHYTASTASVSSRDHITQTCDFVGMYDITTSSACTITAINVTASYVALA